LKGRNSDMPSLGTVPILLTTIASFLLPMGLGAKTKKVKPAQKDPQDQIEVGGHIPVPGDPITTFVVTQHYSRYYLYAKHQGGKDITLIDITNSAHPVVLSDVQYPSGEGSASLFRIRNCRTYHGRSEFFASGTRIPNHTDYGFIGPSAPGGGTRIHGCHSHKQRCTTGIDFPGERGRRLDIATEPCFRSGNAEGVATSGFCAIAPVMAMASGFPDDYPVIENPPMRGGVPSRRA
jgi:hypothetical protein